MDLFMQIGYIEAVVALVLLVVIGPVAQVITLKVGFNGMREDIREIKKSCTVLTTSTAKQDTDIAVHDQRIDSLESRIKKVED